VTELFVACTTFYDAQSGDERADFASMTMTVPSVSSRSASTLGALHATSVEFCSERCAKPLIRLEIEALPESRSHRAAV
jgi:hypothetical protein